MLKTIKAAAIAVCFALGGCGSFDYGHVLSTGGNTDIDPALPNCGSAAASRPTAPLKCNAVIGNYGHSAP